jgi:hypothetical protein
MGKDDEGLKASSSDSALTAQVRVILKYFMCLTSSAELFCSASKTPQTAHWYVKGDSPEGIETIDAPVEAVCVQ